jgi:hypothetical protein
MTNYIVGALDLLCKPEKTGKKKSLDYILSVLYIGGTAVSNRSRSSSHDARLSPLVLVPDSRFFSRAREFDASSEGAFVSGDALVLHPIRTFKRFCWWVAIPDGVGLPDFRRVRP